MERWLAHEPMAELRRTSSNLRNVGLVSAGPPCQALFSLLAAQDVTQRDPGRDHRVDEYPPELGTRGKVLLLLSSPFSFYYYSSLSLSLSLSLLPRLLRFLCLPVVILLRSPLASLLTRPLTIATTVVYNLQSPSAAPPSPAGSNSTAPVLNDTPNAVELPLGAQGSRFLFTILKLPADTPDLPSSYRVIDGALVLVDLVQGVTSDLELALRQALVERVKPILVLTGAETLFFEKGLSHEEIYSTILSFLNSLNIILSTYEDERLGPLRFSPELGNVAFASLSERWCFTLSDIASAYAQRFGVKREQLAKKLWGNFWYDEASKHFVSEPVAGVPRSFCRFVLEPLFKLKAVQEGDHAKLEKMLTSLGLRPSSLEQFKSLPSPFHPVMREWLPLLPTLLRNAIFQLPSPQEAQQYRVDSHYTGPQDDEFASGFSLCDPNGPLLAYVCRMLPLQYNRGRFSGLCRVYSGTLVPSAEKKVCIQTQRTGKPSKGEFFEKSLRGLQLLTTGILEDLKEAPAGSLVLIPSIDQFIINCASITSSPNAYCIRSSLHRSNSTVVRVSIEPANAADLPNMIEGFKRLSKMDPLVECYIDPSGLYIIGCQSEEHLEAVLKDLAEICGGIELKISQPFTIYRESVQARSSQICMSKSPNKHNRLWMTAEPLTRGLAEVLEDRQFRNEELSSLTDSLVEEWGWDKAESRRIWAFAPQESPLNCFVDVTKNVQFLNEIKDCVISALQWATKEGVLAEEPLRGVRFNLQDVTMFTDAVHRGCGQIIPTARRCCYASQLTAEPCLLEPINLVELQCTEGALPGLYELMESRGGHVLNEEPVPRTRLLNVKAFLPVNRCWRFTQELAERTGSLALNPTLTHDHWAVVPGSPFDETSPCGEVVRTIRTRKGLKPDIPSLDVYLDKL